MLKHLRGVSIAALLAAGCVQAAHADDYTVRDGNNIPRIFSGKLVGSVIHQREIVQGINGASPIDAAVDSLGRWIFVGPGTAGAPTGGVVSIQGVGGGTNVNVNCASGCTGSGGQQYAEDAPHASGDLGTMALGVRKDTATALAGTDGDYIPWIVDNAGRLWTHIGVIDAGSNVIGKVGIDQTTPGTTNLVAANVTQIAGSSVQAASNGLNTTGAGVAANAPTLQYDDTSPNVPTENQFAHPRMNSERFAKVQNGFISTPSANYNRPANTTAYPANGLVANNVSGASVVVPSLTVSTEGFRLATAKIWTNTTSGIDTTVFGLDFWSTAPTFTNGDGSDYKTAFAGTGSGANWLGNMTCNGFRQFTDAAVAECWSSSNFPKALKPGTTIYYTTYDVNAFTPQSGKNFAVSVSAEND